MPALHAAQLVFSLMNHKTGRVLLLYRVLPVDASSNSTVDLSAYWQGVVVWGHADGTYKLWFRDWASVNPAELLSFHAKHGFEHETAIPRRHELLYWLSHNKRNNGVKTEFTVNQAKAVYPMMPEEHKIIAWKEAGLQMISSKLANSLAAPSFADAVKQWSAQSAPKGAPVKVVSEPVSPFAERERTPTELEIDP